MRTSSRFGAVAGLAGSSIAIGGNLLRGDPYLVSVFPDVLSIVAVAACVALAVHLAMRRDGFRRATGLRTSVAAGFGFAVAMGGFSLVYLPSHSIVIAAFMTVTSFALAVAVGGLVTALDGRQGPLARAQSH